MQQRARDVASQLQRGTAATIETAQATRSASATLAEQAALSNRIGTSATSASGAIRAVGTQGAETQRVMSRLAPAL
jgi:hypothetical protein